MFAGFEKVVAAQTSMIEFTQNLTASAMEGSKKLAALNFAATEAAIKENAESFKSLLAESQNPAELVKSINPAQFQPLTEKSQAYFKHAYEISSKTGQDMLALVQDQVAQGRTQFETMTADMGQSLPAGAKNYFDTVANMFKSGVPVAATEAKAKRK